MVSHWQQQAKAILASDYSVDGGKLIRCSYEIAEPTAASEPMELGLKQKHPKVEVAFDAAIVSFEGKIQMLP